MLHDLTNKRFGRLLVIKRVSNRGGKPCWKCLCECGKTKNITSSSLKRGTISCGCYVKEINGIIQRKHGYTITHARVYDIWHAMKGRCQNHKHYAYNDYGGRGITVCEKWQTFEGFWEDMRDGYFGNLTLDRIDNDEGYYKENCRWATRKEQSNNTRTVRRINYNGSMKTISELASEFGINYFTLWSRLTELNWSIEKALNTPAQGGVSL